MNVQDAHYRQFLGDLPGNFRLRPNGLFTDDVMDALSPEKTLFLRMPNTMTGLLVALQHRVRWRILVF
jgi:hypothetical protein